MREGQFIKRNLERWQQYNTPTEDPDEMAKRFTYLVDDLGYAKTFYPKSNTIRYINSIAANIYLSIYKNKKVQSHQLLTFWTTDLPLLIRKYHAMLLFSFVVFTSFVLFGFYSAKYDQSVIRSVLGDDYVSMTERNIANGKPFNVYDGGNELSMFLRIAFNNIRVAFATYLMGITAGVGTMYLLFQNGLMVGVFENMFFRQHLGFKSVLVIFIHGTLELWSIVVAGCSGLILGSSMLFPKTYTRIASLRRAATDSVKIIVSLVPSFIIAAFFEGYITRHTEMPVAVSIGILLFFFALIIWYYVIYPIQIEKQHRNGATK